MEGQARPHKAAMEPGPWREDPVRRGLAASLGEGVADYLQGLADNTVSEADAALTWDPLNRNDALGFLGLCLAGHMVEEGEEPPPHVGRSSNHGGPQEEQETPAERRDRFHREHPELR